MPETMVHSRMCMLLPREIALTTCALHMRRGNGPLAEARVLFMSLRLRSGREDEKRQSVFPHGQAGGLVGLDAPKRMAVQALMQEPCATDHDLSALLEAQDVALGFQAVYAVRQRGANGVGPTVVMVSKPVAARTSSSMVALNRDCGWARRTRSCAAMFLLILFAAAAFLFARIEELRLRDIFRSYDFDFIQWKLRKKLQ